MLDKRSKWRSSSSVTRKTANEIETYLTLIDGAVDTNAIRKTSGAIESQIESIMPKENN